MDNSEEVAQLVNSHQHSAVAPFVLHHRHTVDFTKSEQIKLINIRSNVVWKLSEAMISGLRCSNEGYDFLKKT